MIGCTGANLSLTDGVQIGADLNPIDGAWAGAILNLIDGVAGSRLKGASYSFVIKIYYYINLISLCKWWNETCNNSIIVFRNKGFWKVFSLPDLFMLLAVLACVKFNALVPGKKTLPTGKRSILFLDA